MHLQFPCPELDPAAEDVGSVERAPLAQLALRLRNCRVVDPLLWLWGIGNTTMKQHHRKIDFLQTALLYVESTCDAPRRCLDASVMGTTLSVHGIGESAFDMLLRSSRGTRPQVIPSVRRETLCPL